MKKIVLLCSQGASTSILVKAMEKAAAQMEYACDIHAYSINESVSYTHLGFFEADIHIFWQVAIDIQLFEIQGQFFL